jgi:hypothetical protein
MPTVEPWFALVLVLWCVFWAWIGTRVRSWWLLPYLWVLFSAFWAWWALLVTSPVGLGLFTIACLLYMVGFPIYATRRKREAEAEAASDVSVPHQLPSWPEKWR